MGTALKLGYVVESKRALGDIATLDRSIEKLGKNAFKSAERFKKMFTGSSSSGIKNATMNINQWWRGMEASTKAGLKLVAMMAGLAVAFVALTVVIVKSLKQFIEFEKSLLRIRAFTGGSEEDIEKFSDNIREIGKSSIFTANAIASASSQLSKMGIGIADQTGSLEAMVKLATATQTALTLATVTVQKTMNAFVLEAENTGWAVNVLGKAVSKTALDMGSVGVAMQHVGAIADSIGLSLVDTATDLGILADNGIRASRSGRLLKNIYTELADDGSKFNALLKAQGLDLKTAQEKMDWLKQSNMDATTATKLFGRTTGGIAVILAKSAEKSAELSAQLANAKENYIDAAAKMQEEGLWASWKIAVSYIQDAQISIGKFLQPLLSVLIRGGEVSDMFREWTGGNQLGGIQETFRIIAVTVEQVAGQLGFAVGETSSLAHGLDAVMIVFNSILRTMGQWIGTLAFIIKMVGIVGNTLLVGIGGFFTLAYEGLKFLARRFIGFFKMVGGMIKAMGKGILDALNPLKEGTFMKDMADAVVNNFGAIENAMPAIGDAMAQSIKDGIAEGKTAWESYMDFIVESTLGTAGVVTKIVAPSSGGSGTSYDVPDGKKKKKEKGTPSFFEQLFGQAYDPEAIQANVAAVMALTVEWGANFANQTMDILNNVFDMKNRARQREIDATRKALSDDLSGRHMSNRRRQALEKENADKIDKMRADANRKKQKQDKANTIVNMATGVAGAWANAMQLPYPANIIVGGITSAMMTGIGISQLANINSQNFANSGVVGGFGGGSTGGTDNRTVGAREGEMFLNGQDQKTLHDAIKNGNLGGTTNNFYGDITRDHLTEFEEMYNILKSSERITT